MCNAMRPLNNGWVGLDKESLLGWTLFRDMYVDVMGIRWTNTVQQASILYSYILSYVRLYLQEFSVCPDISLCKAAQLWIVEESGRMARDLVFNFLSCWTVKKITVSISGVHRSRNSRDESVCYVIFCYDEYGDLC